MKRDDDDGHARLRLCVSAPPFVRDLLLDSSGDPDASSVKATAVERKERFVLVRDLQMLILPHGGGPVGDQEPTDVRFDAAGNLALTGKFRGFMQWGATGPYTSGKSIQSQGGSFDMFVARFLGNGTFQWVRSFGDTTFNQIGNAIAFGSSNSVVAIGEAQGTVMFQGFPSQTSTGGFDVLLMMVNPGQ